MANFIKTQNSFANGEVSPDFYARDDINGLSKLENMDVLAGGGITRRMGLESVCKLSGDARIISFSVSESNEYIIALTDMHMYIFCGTERVQDIITPWSYSALAHVQYAQRFGTMIFVHPDYPPQVLRQSGQYFTLSEFAFLRNDADMTLNMPFVRFDDASNITITVTTNSHGNNFATFTTSADFWKPNNVGGRLYLLDKQWYVYEYISPTQIVAHTNGAYSLPSSSVSDWREAAFGMRRGWPRSITFHQDRLVFGGSRDWPGGIWMSQVGQHNNFDVGTGLDDEAIFISLLSQQRQQISTVVSSDNLQILTNVGEWAISSKPLTPSSVDIKQHTSIGSYMARFLPPQKIEGATVFMSASGCDIRELGLDELGEHYNANDLCAFARHLIKNPVDMAYNPLQHRLFVVCGDGMIAVLNHNSALGISAWGRYKTMGHVMSVAISDGRTYLATRRADGVFLECFSETAMKDCERYEFSYIASGLPLRASGHSATRVKLRKLVARLLDTKSVHINSHRINLPNEIYSADSPGFCGDVSINLLGTMHDCIQPLWTVHGTDSEPITVLSMTIHGWYSV